MAKKKPKNGPMITFRWPNDDAPQFEVAGAIIHGEARVLSVLRLSEEAPTGLDFYTQHWKELRETIWEKS